MKRIWKELSDSLNIAGGLAFVLFLLPIAFVGRIIYDAVSLVRYIGECAFMLPLSEFLDSISESEINKIAEASTRDE